LTASCGRGAASKSNDVPGVPVANPSKFSKSVKHFAEENKLILYMNDISQHWFLL
jgi:hypothetical protein